MTYKENEIAAILKLAGQMCRIDGDVDFSEIEEVTKFCLSFDIPIEELKILVKQGENLNNGEAFDTLRNMTKDQKKSFVKFLLKIACSDGVFEESEKKLLSIICFFIGFSGEDLNDCIIDFVAD